VTRKTHALVGAFRVDRLIEFEGPFRAATHLFPPATLEEVHATETARDARFYDRQQELLIMAFHALLVRTPDKTILVDTCLGNDKPRPNVPEWNRRSGSFLHDLASLGVRPEDVDFVLCTHLHADHVGWHTRQIDGRWVPTFPRARHLFSRVEFDYMSARVQSEGPLVHHGIWHDSVLPVVDAGLAEFVEDGHEVTPGITLHAAPGHTPGCVMIRLDDGQQVSWLIGDVVHHPIQVERPDWYSRFCDDPAGACASRGRLLELVSDTPMRLIPAHFPGPSSVRIARRGTGYRVVTD